MNAIAKVLLSTLLMAPTALFAETISTTIGKLAAPDGLQVLERDEKPDPKTGKASGIIVFTKANDLPRAVFILTWTAVEPGPKPPDLLDAAVKIGNPFNKALTPKDATPAKVGGIDAGRYEGTLPNGLKAISYVAENGPYRLIVLLKGPAASPYKELVSDFARAVEGFAWALPDSATAGEAPKPPAAQ